MSLKLAYLLTALVYNVTEAAFKVMTPVWIVYLFAIMAVPAAPKRKQPEGAGRAETGGHLGPDEPPAPGQPGRSRKAGLLLNQPGSAERRFGWRPGASRQSRLDVVESLDFRPIALTSISAVLSGSEPGYRTRTNMHFCGLCMHFWKLWGRVFGSNVTRVIPGLVVQNG